MKKKNIISILLAILFVPTLVQSKSRIIHVEWEHQNNENVSEYRLYLENNIVCVSSNPNAISMDCTVDVLDGESLFYITSYYENGTESAVSEPFPYIFSENLMAVMTADTPAGESPHQVTFNAASSTGNILNYHWDFGDGQSGSGENFDHTFVSAGNYTVTLQVTDDLGATDNETIQIVVTTPSPINTPPTAIVSSSTGVGEAPLTVQFDGSGSTDSDGTIVSYRWDMGEGTVLSGPQISYAYTSAGIFDATLLVTDNGGMTDSISTPVIVSPASIENITPMAIISADTSQGIAPLAVFFDGGQSSDPDGTISRYIWNFGDGTTSSSISASHTYTQPATYTVTLDVIDNMGASATTSYLVTVEPEVQELPITMETGEILVSNDWLHVDLTKQFVHPIIIASPISYNDNEPAAIRIRNADKSGFDIRIQEWNYLDDYHGYESIHYIAMEQGNYTLSNGVRIEAGSFTAKNQSFQTVEFNQPFQIDPILFTTISTFNGSDTVTGREKSVSASDFAFKLSEQESKRKTRHNKETIDYIAWEPGSGNIGAIQYEVGKTTDSITHQWGQIDFQLQISAPPYFFANMQSYDGGDNSVVRYQYLKSTEVEVAIEEETSRDSETSHTTETVGYMVFGKEMN